VKDERRQIDDAIVDLVRKPTLSKSAVIAKRKPMGRPSRLRNTRANKLADSR
jgi:hypothetical protein